MRRKSPSVHLNLNVRGLDQSATLKINEISNALLREGRRIFKFGLGQSPFPVPPSVVEELKVNAHQKDYLPVMGLWQLREAVAQYYARKHSVHIAPDNVMIGPGSKELMFLIQLCYYGDLVIPTPSWVSYAPQAHIIGRHIRWVPTTVNDGWRMSADRLRSLCHEDPDRPRLLILNYPSNPAGTTYPIEELKALAAVAREHGVLLLSDEIYGELHFLGQHVSVARFYPEGTIISSGLSKWCGAGGWRLGTFAFPESLSWLRKAMASVASETYTATSAPIQYAAVTAFQDNLDLEEYLFQVRRILKSLGKRLTQKLKKTGALVPEPRGGFYLFPDFSPLKSRLAARGIIGSSQLCEKLLAETGVALLPGSAFGRPEEELTVRLAYVDFDGSRALTAAQAVPPDKALEKEFLEGNCANCLEGIDKLCQWLHG